MNLLLDTHIWLWSAAQPERLAGRLAESLDDPENALWVSPVSIWEIGILASKKRIHLDRAFEKWVEQSRCDLALNEAALNIEVALETHRVRLATRDPADRFLAATARVFDLTLVTADETLIRARGVPTLANE